MNDDSILNRLQSESVENSYHHEGDYKPFGVSRQAVSLNCIFKNGNQQGIAWGLYTNAQFNPREGITFEFTHMKLTIQGHFLASLYHYVMGNGVTFVAEADQATTRLIVSQQRTVISKLSVESN
ncbi:MAG: hypothetical protein AAFN77_18275 [Planctomycetota bacterium]